MILTRNPLTRSLPTTQFSVKRLYSTGLRGSSYTNNYAQYLEQVRSHSHKSAETWRKISIFVCAPLIVLTGYNAYRLLQEHKEHLQHEPLRFVGYPYIRIRNRPFPWQDSDHSLFHNPKVNLDPPEE